MKYPILNNNVILSQQKRTIINSSSGSYIILPEAAMPVLSLVDGTKSYKEIYAELSKSYTLQFAALKEFFVLSRKEMGNFP